MPADVRAALARAALVGPYFATASETDGSWRPLRELIDDPAVLAARVAFARDFLQQRTGSNIELRACASINSLGVLSRLVAPALATACLDGVVPALTVDDIAWQPVDGGPLPVAFRVTSGVEVRHTGQAAAALTRLVDSVARPVLEAYRDGFGVSPKTLWGNLASALNGAAGMLPAGAAIAPSEIVASLLKSGLLRDAGRYEPYAGRRWFVRNNCCLFYRVPAGGKCGDCVLVPEAARHDMWQAASALS